MGPVVNIGVAQALTLQSYVIRVAEYVDPKIFFKNSRTSKRFLLSILLCLVIT